MLRLQRWTHLCPNARETVESPSLVWKIFKSCSFCWLWKCQAKGRYLKELELRFAKILLALRPDPGEPTSVKLLGNGKPDDIEDNMDDEGTLGRINAAIENRLDARDPFSLPRLVVCPGTSPNGLSAVLKVSNELQLWFSLIPLNLTLTLPHRFCLPPHPLRSYPPLPTSFHPRPPSWSSVSLSVSPFSAIWHAGFGTKPETTKCKWNVLGCPKTRVWLGHPCQWGPADVPLVSSPPQITRKWMDECVMCAKPNWLSPNLISEALCLHDAKFIHYGWI